MRPVNNTLVVTITVKFQMQMPRGTHTPTVHVANVNAATYFDKDFLYAFMYIPAIYIACMSTIVHNIHSLDDIAQNS